jgi:hypothetical protein
MPYPATSCETKAIRRVAVSKEREGFTINERWTSTGLNINFNDLVTHKGYAYGFDGPSIACIDLKNEKRMLPKLSVKKLTLDNSRCNFGIR